MKKSLTAKEKRWLEAIIFAGIHEGNDLNESDELRDQDKQLLYAKLGIFQKEAS